MNNTFDIQLPDKYKSNEELVEEALEELQDVMDYVASESGDCNILNWLGPVEEKLKLVLDKLQED